MKAEPVFTLPGNILAQFDGHALYHPDVVTVPRGAQRGDPARAKRAWTHQPRTCAAPACSSTVLNLAMAWIGFAGPHSEIRALCFHPLAQLEAHPASAMSDP
jgi:hypothetical protein